MYVVYYLLLRLFSSLIHVYLYNALCIADGTHISGEGLDLVINKLFLPFFISQMEPKETDHLYMNKTSPYDVEVHMFPFSNYHQKLIISKCHQKRI